MSLSLSLFVFLDIFLSRELLAHETRDFLHLVAFPDANPPLRTSPGACSAFARGKKAPNAARLQVPTEKPMRLVLVRLVDKHLRRASPAPARIGASRLVLLVLLALLVSRVLVVQQTRGLLPAHSATFR